MNTLALAWKRAAEAWERAAYWEAITDEELKPLWWAAYWRRAARALTDKARRMEEEAHI